MCLLSKKKWSFYKIRFALIDLSTTLHPIEFGFARDDDRRDRDDGHISKKRNHN